MLTIKVLHEKIEQSCLVPDVACKDCIHCCDCHRRPGSSIYANALRVCISVTAVLVNISKPTDLMQPASTIYKNHL